MVTKSFGNALIHISMHDMLSIPWSKITLCYIVLSTLPGAYELPKTAKECETEFHDNPNYVTVFVLHHMQMALQLHEVEMSSPEKDLEEDSTNFTITMCHWSCAILYIASNKWDFTFLIWKLISD